MPQRARIAACFILLQGGRAGGLVLCAVCLGAGAITHCHYPQPAKSSHAHRTKWTYVLLDCSGRSVAAESGGNITLGPREWSCENYFPINISIHRSTRGSHTYKLLLGYPYVLFFNNRTSIHKMLTS
jgi:hypothetical protein